MINLTSHPYVKDNLKKMQNARFIELCAGSIMALVIVASLSKDSQNYPIIEAPAVVAGAQIKSSDKLTNPSFLKLLGKTEGFSEHFYMDNKGIAGAYGWNITQNSESFNRKVGKLAGLKKQEIIQIQALSKKNVKSVPLSISHIQIDEKKAQKTVNFLYEFYLKEFEAVFLKKSNNDIELLGKMRNDFTSEQKAVFAHMAYKVGISGLQKYENFYDAMFEYLEKRNPKKEDLEKIKEEIAYVYFVGGEKKRDQKVQDIHRDQFMAGSKPRLKNL